MPTMKEIIMQKLTTFRLSDDTHDRCLSFEHEGYMYTLIDIKDKERADYRRYFQQYFLNAKKAEAIGLPCETMLMKEIPEEALVLRSKYIDHDTNPDWITTKEMFHQIITVPLFDTLKKLHDQGFAHGDFTESNIFLSKSERIVKYADFKHLQKYDTREVYTWNHAKLIDIYDAIQSVLHIAEYSCRDAFGGTSDEEPSDNVLDFLRTQQKILEPIKAAEGDANKIFNHQTRWRNSSEYNGEYKTNRTRHCRIRHGGRTPYKETATSQYLKVSWLDHSLDPAFHSQHTLSYGSVNKAYPPDLLFHQKKLTLKTRQLDYNKYKRTCKHHLGKCLANPQPMYQAGGCDKILYKNCANSFHIWGKPIKIY